MPSRSHRMFIPVLVGALVFSIAWTFLSILPEPKQDPVEAATISLMQDYRVITGKPLTTWPSGSILKPGMAAYFYAAAPTLQVIPTAEVSGLKNGSLHCTAVSEVVLQAIDDKTRVYWSNPLMRGEEQRFTVSANESGESKPTILHAPLEPIDISAAYSLAAQINEELAYYNGLLQLVIISRFQVNGTANSISIDKDISLSMPITLQQVSFSAPIPQDMVSELSLARDKSPASQKSPMDFIRENPLPFLLDILLLTLLLVLLMKKSTARSHADKEHRRFREWITEGVVDAGRKLTINILRLEGLVDLAIDLDKRVIYDAKAGKYYVLAEELVYVYDPALTHALQDNRPQLGRLLLNRGLIRPEQLEIGLYYQKKIGGRLGESLTALGFIDETTLYSTLAAQQNMDYYELNPSMDFSSAQWLDRLSIQRARAMMVLPLGERADGKLVTACSEISREGIQKALEEILGREILLVAARPSALYQALDRLEANVRNKAKASKLLHEREGVSRHLAEEEKAQFISAYIRGRVLHEILLQAAGTVEQDTIRKLPEQEDLLTWLVAGGKLPSDFANLAKGLDKAVEALDWKSRQQKKAPGLLELLGKANYLSAHTLDWVNRELALQEVSAEQLLQNSFLASQETISHASSMLRTLESILEAGSNT